MPDEENNRLPMLACQLRAGNDADETLARDVDDFTRATGFTVSALVRAAVREYLDGWRRSQELKRVIQSMERTL